MDFPHQVHYVFFLNTTYTDWGVYLKYAVDDNWKMGVKTRDCRDYPPMQWSKTKLQPFMSDHAQGTRLSLHPHKIMFNALPKKICTIQSPSLTTGLASQALEQQVRSKSCRIGITAVPTIWASIKLPKKTKPKIREMRDIRCFDLIHES